MVLNIIVQIRNFVDILLFQTAERTVDITTDCTLTLSIFIPVALANISFVPTAFIA